MRPSKSIRFAIATFKDPLMVLSYLSKPSNSLSGNSLFLSPASIKNMPCSTSLTVVSMSLDVISISSIAYASVVDEDGIAFDLLFKASSNFLSFILAFLYFAL